MKLTLLLLLTPLFFFAQQGNGDYTARIFYDVEEALQTPKEVFKLHLDHSQLAKISPNIVKFQNLRDLQLGGNPDLNWVKTFELLAQLPNLEKLSLSENNLEVLPATIRQMSALEELVLVGNPQLNWWVTFSHLAALPNLSKLDIGNNKIKDLPANIGQMTA